MDDEHKPEKQLLLLGIRHDAQRIEKLAAILETLGFSCAFEWTDLLPAADVAPARQPLICWTRDSVGPRGTSLLARAVMLKESGRYLGVLFDKIKPPEAIRIAEEIDIVGWEVADDPTGPIEPLRQRIEKQAPSGSLQPFRAILQRLRAIIASINRRLSALQQFAILTLIVSAIGLYADLGGMHQICQASAVRSTCRAMSWGNVPSVAEEAEFIRARVGQDCGAFQIYLRRYGAQAAFALEARQRLKDLYRDISVPTRYRLETAKSVPYGAPGPEAKARADLLQRGDALARASCTQQAQSFAGEWAPGRFDGLENCDDVNGRFICNARGKLICSIIENRPKRICPP